MTKVLLFLLLILVCGSLGWELNRQWNTPLPEPSIPEAASGGVAALPADPQYRMPPEESYSAIIERPLFSPSRRPPEGGPVEVVTSRDLAINFTGVSITAGERWALFERKDGKGKLQLQEGDEFQGWILEVIEALQVTFRQDAEEQVLPLKFEVGPERPTRRTKRRVRQQSAPAQPQQDQNGRETEEQPERQ